MATRECWNKLEGKLRLQLHARAWTQAELDKIATKRGTVRPQPMVEGLMVQEDVCLVIGREAADDIGNSGGESILDALDGLHVGPVNVVVESSVGSALL